jgi:hypothetical protein
MFQRKQEKIRRIGKEVWTIYAICREPLPHQVVLSIVGMIVIICTALNIM